MAQAPIYLGPFDRIVSFHFASGAPWDFWAMNNVAGELTLKLANVGSLVFQDIDIGNISDLAASPIGIRGYQQPYILFRRISDGWNIITPNGEFTGASVGSNPLEAYTTNVAQCVGDGYLGLLLKNPVSGEYVMTDGETERTFTPTLTTGAPVLIGTKTTLYVAWQNQNFLTPDSRSLVIGLAEGVIHQNSDGTVELATVTGSASGAPVAMANYEHYCFVLYNVDTGTSEILTAAFYVDGILIEEILSPIWQIVGLIATEKDFFVVSKELPSGGSDGNYIARVTFHRLIDTESGGHVYSQLSMDFEVAIDTDITIAVSASRDVCYAYIKRTVNADVTTFLIDVVSSDGVQVNIETRTGEELPSNSLEMNPIGEVRLNGEACFVARRTGNDLNVLNMIAFVKSNGELEIHEAQDGANAGLIGAPWGTMHEAYALIASTFSGNTQRLLIGSDGTHFEVYTPFSGLGSLADMELYMKGEAGYAFVETAGPTASHIDLDEVTFNYGLIGSQGADVPDIKSSIIRMQELEGGVTVRPTGVAATGAVGNVNVVIS